MTVGGLWSVFGWWGWQLASGSWLGLKLWVSQLANGFWLVKGSALEQESG